MDFIRIGSFLDKMENPLRLAKHLFLGISQKSVINITNSEILQFYLKLLAIV